MAPLLSIVIPTFNRSEVLVRNLAGLDLLDFEQIEIIVVDDQSDASHQEYLQNALHDRSGVRLIFSKGKKGAPAARNRGFYESRSPWIWFLDDDDKISKETIDQVVSRIADEKHNSLIFLCARLNAEDGITRVVPTGANLFSTLRKYGQSVNTSCAIIERELIEKIGLWDERLVAGQDTDLFLRLSKYTDATVFDDLFVDISIHKNSRITSNPKKQWIGKFQFLAKHFRDLHIARSARYLLSIILFYPYLRILIGKVYRKKKE